MHGSANKADKYTLWLRDVAVVETFFATGARGYEISDLKKECID